MTDSTAAITLAIAVRDHSKFSETFVRRHVARLFDGRTVVVALSGAAEAGETRPLLVTDPGLARLPPGDFRRRFLAEAERAIDAEGHRPLAGGPIAGH